MRAGWGFFDHDIWLFWGWEFRHWMEYVVRFWVYYEGYMRDMKCYEGFEMYYWGQDLLFYSCFWLTISLRPRIFRSLPFKVILREVTQKFRSSFSSHHRFLHGNIAIFLKAKPKSVHISAYIGTTSTLRPKLWSFARIESQDFSESRLLFWKFPLEIGFALIFIAIFLKTQLKLERVDACSWITSTVRHMS